MFFIRAEIDIKLLGLIEKPVENLSILSAKFVNQEGVKMTFKFPKLTELRLRGAKGIPNEGAFDNCTTLKILSVTGFGDQEDLDTILTNNKEFEGFNLRVLAHLKFVSEVSQ